MRIPAAPSEADFTSRLRSATVAARVGLWLGVCFGICFLTGLISHYAQNPDHPIPFPTSPANLGSQARSGRQPPASFRSRLHIGSSTAASKMMT